LARSLQYAAKTPCLIGFITSPVRKMWSTILELNFLLELFIYSKFKMLFYTLTCCPIIGEYYNMKDYFKKTVVVDTQEREFNIHLSLTAQ
jgi:hypothetical protein